MNYFLDTEFHEYTKEIPRTGHLINTIELISIGLVCEDGREYYAIYKEFDLETAWYSNQGMEDKPDYWLRENVLKGIAEELLVREWFKNLEDTEYSRNIVCETDKEGFDLFNEMMYNKVEPQITYETFKRLVCKYGKTKKQIAEDILNFVYPTSVNGWLNPYEFNVQQTGILPKNLNPVFYAYYADYDWVVFCWLFSRMIDLPKGFPMYCRDLKQTLDEKDLDFDWVQKHCPKPENVHNALADAKWNKDLYTAIRN